MKILFVLDNGQIGGAEKLALNFEEKLKAYSHNCAILILEKDKSITTFSDREIKFFFAIRKFKLDIAGFIKKIKYVLEEYKPQIVLANGVFSYFFISLAIARLKLKIPRLLIFHSVSPFSFLDWMFDFFYLLILHIFKGRWVILYPGQEKNIIRRFLLKRKDIRLIHGGVDISFYARITQVPIVAPSSKENIFTIAHISSLKPIKNQIALFNSLKIFDTNLKANWQLLIVGQGRARLLEYYKKTLKNLDIYEKVKFLGILKDVRTVLNKSDIFILTSFTEALPLSALEALSMGVPCILPKVGGCPYIIEEGINGYLIKPKDYRGLADLLTNIYLDKEKLKNLKENSRRITLEKFNFANTVNDFINLCEKEVVI
ncbi:MAG: glycosyltransferase [Candidatus Omnitrophota bacterium]|nr:glycosyltransferase [Candidatus Omnitrophota bacterium]